MAKYEWLIGVLKYAGLVIAFIASLWGMTTENKDVKWKKVMPFVFLIVGFLISLVSNIVEDQLSKIKENAQNQAELARTNRIILSGQPLSSMTLNWIFHGKDRLLNSVISHGEKLAYDYAANVQGRDVIGDEAALITRTFDIDPFINGLFRDSLFSATRSYLLLFSLDNNQNAILPVGVLDTAIIWGNNSYKALATAKQTLPGGIHFPAIYSIEESTMNDGAGIPSNPVNDHIGLDPTSKDGYVLSWDLQPLTLANAVVKMVPELAATPNFPAEFKVLLFFNIRSLPFSSTNLAKPDGYNVWTENQQNTNNIDTRISARVSSLFSHSAIEITPNGQTEQKVYYDFEYVHDQEILDDDLTPCETRCWVIKFKRRGN